MKMNKWWLHQYCNNDGSVKLRLNQCKPNKKNYWVSDSLCMGGHSFFTYYGNGFETLEEALEYQEEFINIENMKFKYVIQTQETNNELLTSIMSKCDFLKDLSDIIYNTELLYDKYEQRAEDTEDFNDFEDYSIYFMKYVIEEIEAGYTVELGNMAFYKI